MRRRSLLLWVSLALLATSAAVHGTTFVVNTTFDELNAPSGANVSLREALRDAAQNAGADTIVFATALDGQTIVLGSLLLVNDAGGVTVDAFSLPHGITIDGGPDTNRIFTVPSGSVLTLRNLTLTGGDGTDTLGGGGAIANRGLLTMTRCTLTGNTAIDNGGAIHNLDGTLVMTDCTLSNNSAGGSGGAIRSLGSTFPSTAGIFLTRCTLSGNKAEEFGGAISSPVGVTLTQCTLSGNTAKIGGAVSHSAIASGSGGLDMLHCTVVGNQATVEGGGIVKFDSFMRLHHCLISGNTAPPAHGAGMLLNGTAAGTNLVRNCIIAGNTSTDVDRVASSSVFISSEGNNRIGDGNATWITTAGDVFGAGDPLVAPLADNGGPTKTHAILPGSPARDATVNSTSIEDQRHFAIFGPPDIGAYELWVGNFTLGATVFDVGEGQTAAVTINLTPGHPGNATVRLFTVAGTATVADFGNRPNTVASDVVFLPGENTKVLHIPITVDTLTEGPHTFTVKLGTPTPTAFATIGAPNTATVTINDSLVVTNTNDAGPGSLRQAFLDAATAPGTQSIGFLPALNGQSIVLTSEIAFNDTTGAVTLDASSLHAGLIIDGGPGTNRLFFVNTSTTLTLRNLILTGGNGAGTNGEFGGAIRNQGNLTIERCTLSGNTASQRGGAIRSTGALTMRQCTLSGNTAALDGGAIYHTGTIMTLSQCTISGNTALFGGGVSLDSSSMTFSFLVHCTITGNTATGAGALAGGVFCRGRLNIEHCLITGNIAPAGEGGGVGSVGNSGTETIVKNSIISRNSASDVDLVSATTANSFTSEGNNFIGTGDAIADFNVLGDVTGAGDPGVDGTLANNGGPTRTHNLRTGSFARDAAVGSFITADQRGFSVVKAPDIGAFEVQQGGTFRVDGEATVLEGGSVTIEINREGGFSGAATVRLFTVPGTATEADYAARPNTPVSDITFADNEREIEVVIPIKADALAEGNHSFTVRLGSPSPAPAATLGTDTSIVVTIKDSIVVTNINDDGPGSLRQAVNTAASASSPGDDVITFAAALNGKTITLGGEIIIFGPHDITIDATALPAGLTIDGGPGPTRIFSLNNPSRSLNLLGLTLTGGDSLGLVIGQGGALNIVGSANLTRCTLFNNNAEARGGAIYLEQGTLTMTQCTISGNTAAQGAGIVLVSADAVLEHCTVANNSAGIGGGIHQLNGDLTVRRCIIADNSAGPNSGGGIFINSNSSFTHEVTNSIIVGNAQTDLDFSGTNTFVSGGHNRVGDGTAISKFNGPGDVTGVTVSFLVPLAANGGPTRTHALDLGSLAINSTTGSTVTRDQRGVPVVGLPDIGAFEAQNAFFFVASPSVTEGQPVQVVIRRMFDIGRPASVRLFTTPGSAGAADFSPRPNTAASQVNFLPGDVQVPLSIPTVGGDLSEPNESFTVTLSNPSAGYTVAPPSSTLVVLRDPDEDDPQNDLSFASASFTFPAQNAILDVPMGGFITSTGTATDNKGVVLVLHNQVTAGPFAVASLKALRAATTGWAHTFQPATGRSTLDLMVIDTQGNTRTITGARTFTVRRPLAINISGVGSVTPGFAPSSFRVVGSPQTITATAGTGALFSNWTVLSGHTNADLGISSAALEKPTITFIHRENLALRALFVPNPYKAPFVGTFNGAIRPSASLPDRPPLGSNSGEDVTAPGLSTEGYASLTVQPTGAFSGTLKIDGLSLPVAGNFDANGQARFGSSRASTLALPRPNKPAYSLTLSMSSDAATSAKIIGFLTQTENQAITAVSVFDVKRAAFSVANPLLAGQFGASSTRPVTGLYTMIMPLQGLGGLPLDRVAGGASHGTATLGANGVISVACTLSEGTPLIFSTTISQTGQWRLFSQLYPGLQGYIAGDFIIDHAHPNSDFRSINVVTGADSTCNWVRPVLDRQHYPMGWQNPITVFATGARYIVTPNESVVKVARDTGQGGNAFVIFSNGGLASSHFNTVDIDDADRVTELTSGFTFNVSINRTKGVFSGTLRHDDGTTTPYSGVVFQKGGGVCSGFFLTTTPNPKDYTGQSGGAFITPR